MSEEATRYALHGRHLRICWSEEMPRRALETVFEYHGLVRTADGEATWTITGDSARALPEAATYVAEHASGLKLWRLADDYFIVHSAGTLRISLSSGHVSGTFPETAPGDALSTELYVAITLLLLLLLEADGLYAVHAACLVSPSGQGVLLIGPSDSGKSTMALHLVSQGWRYLSDDSVLLFDAGDAVRVWPLRRDFCVDPEAGTLFPVLEGGQSQMLTDADKWRVRMDGLFPAQQATSCRADFLLFPQITPDQAHSTSERLRPIAALTALLPQASLLRRDPENARTFTQLLQRLVAQAPAHRFFSGQDVYRDGAQLAHLLHALLISTHAETPQT